MSSTVILAQAVLQILCSQDCFTMQDASQKRDIIQSNINNKFPSYSGDLNLGYKLYGKYHDPSSGGFPDILFPMPLMAIMPKSEKGHNSSQKF